MRSIYAKFKAFNIIQWRAERLIKISQSRDTAWGFEFVWALVRAKNAFVCDQMVAHHKPVKNDWKISFLREKNWRVIEEFHYCLEWRKLVSFCAYIDNSDDDDSDDNRTKKNHSEECFHSKTFHWTRNDSSISSNFFHCLFSWLYNHTQNSTTTIIEGAGPFFELNAQRIIEAVPFLYFENSFSLTWILEKKIISNIFFFLIKTHWRTFTMYWLSTILFVLLYSYHKNNHKKKLYLTLNRRCFQFSWRHRIPKKSSTHTDSWMLSWL